mmetsp:Transcript_6595/g.19462  ORF Transcript_6595/g.19462 Transcript_6595/m.19462 type:complete len:237 (-) Transcript_6595:321-1031(-)
MPSLRGLGEGHRLWRGGCRRRRSRRSGRGGPSNTRHRPHHRGGSPWAVEPRGGYAPRHGDRDVLLLLLPRRGGLTSGLLLPLPRLRRGGGNARPARHVRHPPGCLGRRHHCLPDLSGLIAEEDGVALGGEEAVPEDVVEVQRGGGAPGADGRLGGGGESGIGGGAGGPARGGEVGGLHVCGRRGLSSRRRHALLSELSALSSLSLRSGVNFESNARSTSPRFQTASESNTAPKGRS